MNILLLHRSDSGGEKGAPGDDLDELGPEREDLVPAVEPVEVAGEDPVLGVGDLSATLYS